MKKNKSEFKVGDILEPVEYTSESGKDPHLELELVNAELEITKTKNARHKALFIGMSVLLVVVVLAMMILWIFQEP